MSKRKLIEKDTRYPKGLYIFHEGISDTKDLLDFFENVEWFQRFGKQYPNTAHYNGHHCMAKDHKVIESAVREAINIAQTKCSHPALSHMKNNIDDVSVATMRHKGAVREPAKRGNGTKLVKEGWGLGSHPDTWAPDGEGLVLMICVATTSSYHREFKFTCPALGWNYSFFTPNATVVVFTDEAYDIWEHESVRSKWQDGECISMTIRIKSIDSYYGWSVPDKLSGELLNMSHISSVGYARQKQQERIEKMLKREQAVVVSEKNAI
tara:strand:- start:3053 stop:3850 length:798 start_codon:yes stop_codon:yes gene_type:complete